MSMKCSVCEREVGFFGRFELKDGYICNDCFEVAEKHIKGLSYENVKFLPVSALEKHRIKDFISDSPKREKDFIEKLIAEIKEVVRTIASKLLKLINRI